MCVAIFVGMSYPKNSQAQTAFEKSYRMKSLEELENSKRFTPSWCGFATLYNRVHVLVVCLKLFESVP